MSTMTHGIIGLRDKSSSQKRKQRNDLVTKSWVVIHRGVSVVSRVRHGDDLALVVPDTPEDFLDASDWIVKGDLGKILRSMVILTFQV